MEAGRLKAFRKEDFQALDEEHRMLEVQTMQAKPVEFNPCEDRSWLSVEELNSHPKKEKADENIAEKVDRALWNDDMLRSTDYGEIGIHVKEGIVYLTGHVITTMNKRRAENAVRTIPGILGVNIQLVSDEELMREVAAALGKIEHTYGVKFFTGMRNGVVILNGDVENAEVGCLAEKCASEIPYVRGVINNVRAPGIDFDAIDQRFLQPSIGQEMYFTNGLFGTVKQVIINPNNRRVVGMIVQQRYSDPLQEPQSLAGSGVEHSERLFVVPVSAIRHLTKSGGLLRRDDQESDRYGVFDPAFFAIPNTDWVAPYPYCPEQVLFPVENMSLMENVLCFVAPPMRVGMMSEVSPKVLGSVSGSRKTIQNYIK